MKSSSSRIAPPLLGIINWTTLRMKTERQSGLHKPLDFGGDSRCARPCGWFTRGCCQKNKSSSLEQRVSAAARRCVCRPPASPAPEPQPRPSDVCVSSLMKKFWYLGETLLSAEQTLPPPCPPPLHSHTAAPPNRSPIRPSFPGS